MVASLVAGPAHADDGAAKPWEKGVSGDDREAALKAFQAGNAHFTEAEFARAAQLYRQALKHWDHPRVHGNLATALIHLDDPLDAMAHIERALEYGPTPFKDAIYSQLLTQRKLLRGQLSTIEVKCDLPGAEVTVDGKPLYRTGSA